MIDINEAPDKTAKTLATFLIDCALEGEYIQNIYMAAKHLCAMGLGHLEYRTQWESGTTLWAGHGSSHSIPRIPYRGKKENNMKVHVLVIDAENAGNLISCHATRGNALAEVLKYAQENWEEDFHGKMPEDPKKIIDTYFGNDNGEDFYQIEECEVGGLIESTSQYAGVSWSVGDVQSLRPCMSTEQAEQFLADIEDDPRDRMIERGWDEIENSLHSPVKCDECVDCDEIDKCGIELEA